MCVKARGKPLATHGEINFTESKKMKKIFLSVLFLVSFLMAQTSTLVSAANFNGATPLDVQELRFFNTDNTDAGDSLGSGDAVLIGPIETANARGVMFTAFQLYQKAITDSASIAYQVTPSIYSSDTLSGAWTVADTLDDDGINAYHSLGSVIGKYLWFRISNINTDETRIATPLYITFKSPVTIEVLKQ